MRRNDFSGMPDDAAAIMAAVETGELGIMDPEGFPRVVPINFVWHEGAVWFHGAVEGEKYALLKTGPKVTFMAYLQYSYVPSHWRSPVYACPASIFYKSVYIKGRGTVVDDLPAAADALQALMEKYQPDGGFTKISRGEPIYAKAFKETALFRVEPQSVEVKSKFGQNLVPDVRQMIISKLKERGAPLDMATAREMEKAAPVPGK